jgi:hypothetical protein
VVVITLTTLFQVNNLRKNVVYYAVCDKPGTRA